MHLETALVEAAVNPSGGLSPVLDRSTTYQRWPASPYGRGTSPTVDAVEKVLGQLEDAHARVFASGMMAWTCICLGLLGERRAVAIPTVGYYEVELFAAQVLDRFGVEARRYRPGDLEGFARACDGAAVGLVETPANPTMAITDLRAAAEAAHAGGALLAVDNTFCTPLLQRPLDLGADLTWQSATKYLAGHSDVLAGVVATRDDGLLERVIAVRRMIGGILMPDPAWLLLRGMRTLSLRVARQSETALTLAQRLQEHPRVAAVHYPGLPDHPAHEVARAQMGGTHFGGVLSIELATADEAHQVESRLQLIACATSLGGVETLAERRGRIEPEGRVPPGLIRFACGLEHPDDLWVDLEGALGS